MDIVRGFFLVGLGGFLGAALRYGVMLVCGVWFAESLLTATMVVNILGSFAIGAVFELAQSSGSLKSGIFLLCATGILGGFTTFSAFSLENYLLLKEGSYLLAAGNITINLVLCLAGVFLGALVIKLAAV